MYRYVTFFNEIDKLGHIMRPRRFETASYITNATKGRDTTLKVTITKLLLRSYNVLTRFASKRSGILFALNEKLQEVQPFNFNLSQQTIDAMRSYKLKLKFSPVLALPYEGNQIKLYTDACNLRVGCALFQDHPYKTTEPLRYWFRSLTSAARVYDTTP